MHLAVPSSVERRPCSDSVSSQLVAKAGAVEQQVCGTINLSTRSEQSDHGRLLQSAGRMALSKLCNEVGSLTTGLTLMCSIEPADSNV